ncbi:MAG: exonuclease SbcCD subunit D [Coriobacteriia bacterium]|nr:exonuclease SbcCD subunit D [Coriobacteriia bacterium]
MRFLHTGDLHIGKRLAERSLLDDQRFVFQQMLDIAREQAVDAVLIAGDVFDKTAPGREALELSEWLLAGFVAQRLPVFVVPGNHDSAQLVSYCSTVLEASGLHVAKAYAGEVTHVRLKDAEGPVDVHLLPFVRPTDVRMAHPEDAEDIRTHDDAVRVALAHAAVDPAVRNVLVAHQFVVNGDQLPETCQSETVSVGGIDSVQMGNFAAFDYVALGHLHGRQQVGRPQVRYSGSPVKYSFSECSQVKSVCVVDVGVDGVTVQEVPLRPLREMREVSGSFEDLIAGSDTGDHDDYVRVRLTDRSVYDAFNRLRSVYPNLLKLDWADLENATVLAAASLADMKAKSPAELFGDFFLQQAGKELSAEERELFDGVMASAAEGGAR